MTTFLLYAVAPAAGLALIASATMLRRSGRPARYRSGGEWPYEPMWWMGNPRGSGVPAPALESQLDVPAGTHTARGGARGTW